MDKQISRVLANRYAHNLGALANKIAKQIHHSLDAEVVKQLGTEIQKEYNLSEESWQLAGRLRQWYRRADKTVLLTGIISVTSLNVFLISRNLTVKLTVIHTAFLSSWIAVEQRKTRRETALIANTLSLIESAQIASELVRVVKPVKMVETVQKATESLPVSELKPTEVTEWKVPQFDLNQVLGEATGIGLLGNSGSGKSCVAKLIAGALPNYQKLVLDPHDDPANSNWEGLLVITDYQLIAEQLELLLDLLTNRDRTPLLIICDEWPAVRLWCKQRGLSIADDFLIRYGSEARKFDKLPLFCSQSGNTKALGLEGLGDFLENFMLIRLNKIARKYAKNLPDQTILQALNSTAYCCLVNDEVCGHPTHSHHERVYKGAPPQGLPSLRSLPLTIPLAS